MYIRINGRVIKKRNGTIKIGTGMGCIRKGSGSGSGERSDSDNIEKLIDNIATAIKEVKISKTKAKTPKVTERKYIKF